MPNGCAWGTAIRHTMAWIFTFCSLLSLLLDYLMLSRLCHNPKHQRGWMITLAILDTLPTIINLPLYLFSFDNHIPMSALACWTNYLFMVGVVARLPFSFFYVISRNKWVRAVGAACSLVAVALFLYGMAVTHTDYVVNEVTIQSSRLPQAFDGYHIVQISDIHAGNLVDAEKEIAEVVELSNSLDADMVAFCGDMIDIRHSEITPQIVDILKRLKATDGVYSITGNHDIGVYIRDSIRLTLKENTRQLMDKQQQMGWRTLDNQTEYIHRGEDSISLTGISFSQSLQEKRHSSNMSQVTLDSIYINTPREVFNITLVHLPQLWDNIREAYPADLTLSGHVHAMQIAAKVGQWRLSPSMLLYKRWSGLYEEQGRYLYINDGVGYGLYPMRIGARPEITLLELKCSQKQQ